MTGDRLMIEVQRALARAGFDLSPDNSGGLYLAAHDSGVVVGWDAEDVLRPTFIAHSREQDLQNRIQLVGIRTALSIPLTEILREAGLHVASHEQGLLLVTPG
ncbi:hypothetical protein ACFYUJ_34300 [Streptomyces sp. NPDC004520]|uniref:hypothetical protein n=1 Tax=Streptomyces sp. NPDC004520 TaxID=3364702 RepID=UPI0036A1D652